MARPTATPTRGEVRYDLTLTEAEVNELVQDALALQPGVPVSNVMVRFERDLITASGRARAGFLTLNMEIDATITVQGGTAIPEIVEIRAGGQRLTGFLRAQVDNMIAPYLQQWLQMDTGIIVEEVEIGEDSIQITGRYK
jgi:hypothetical protein